MVAIASPNQQAALPTATSTTSSAAPTIANGNASAFYSAVTTLGNAVGYDLASNHPNEPTNNLPFDFRVRRSTPGNTGSGTDGGGTFTAGSGVTSGVMSTVGTNTIFSCYFLFNPTEIDLDYEFDDSVIGALNPAFLGGNTAGQSQGLMLNQTISFTLFFDRTYELWTGANTTTPTQWGLGPYQYGVLWDIWAIERLVGIFGQSTGGPPSGPPAAAPVNVSFGGANPMGSQVPLAQTNITTPIGYQTFTGWMTSLEVQETRFDASMRPSRCAVAVSFEQIYSLQSMSTNSGSAASSDTSSTDTSTSNVVNSTTGVGGANTG